MNEHAHITYRAMTGDQYVSNDHFGAYCRAFISVARTNIWRHRTHLRHRVYALSSKCEGELRVVLGCGGERERSRQRSCEGEECGGGGGCWVWSGCGNELQTCFVTVLGTPTWLLMTPVLSGLMTQSWADICAFTHTHTSMSILIIHISYLSIYI